MGWIDLQTLTINVTIYVAGIKIGEIVGEVRNGIEIIIDGLLVKGSIKIFTKSGKDVWVQLSLTVFGKGISGEWQIYPFKSHEISEAPQST